MAVSKHSPNLNPAPSLNRMHLRPLRLSPGYKAAADEPTPEPTAPDCASRSSFSSIREQGSALPQSFSRSKVSSYFETDETIDDQTSSPTTSPSASARPFNMIQTRFQPPVTQPHSRLLGHWTPADSFKGWKGIQVKGKLASKSFGDLQVLHQVFSGPPRPAKRGASRPGDAPIERLPAELLGSIINLLALDVPPNGITRRNVDLMSLLLTSRTLHYATLDTLYSRVTIPHSRIFHKFLTHIAAHPNLGPIVRRLDFSHFNPTQLFATAAERSQARNLTSETLLRCLGLTPYLQEFLAQEHLDDDLDAGVLQKLFLGLPQLVAVDFCGCTSRAFKESFAAILSPDWPRELSVRRLSLHKCLTLPSAVLEAILPRLPRLTHLDVAGTRITDAALASIPPTAALTHLNLAKCTLLSARAVIDFLAHHPAARELQFLSLATDARSHQLLDAGHVTELLPLLPRTLKSLSLKGSKMDAAAHVGLLRPLTKHLEELALGRSLTLADVNHLLVPNGGENDDDRHDKGTTAMQLDWAPHALHYLDLSDMWGGELDLAYLFGSRSSGGCAVLRPASEPLEVVELAEDVFRRLSKASSTALRGVGWRLSECGSRGWMVRDHYSVGGGSGSGSGSSKSDGRRPDDGSRGWKMGAESWGMRKVPVARAEVGGMYGSFMFGRKL